MFPEGADCWIVPVSDETRHRNHANKLTLEVPLRTGKRAKPTSFWAERTSSSTTAAARASHARNSDTYTLPGKFRRETWCWPGRRRSSSSKTGRE